VLQKFKNYSREEFINPMLANLPVLSHISRTLFCPMTQQEVTFLELA